jgi:hypothetical protein
MTPRDIQDCVDALAEHRDASREYRNGNGDFSAEITRYKRAESELQRLLWLHGPGLIELAAVVSQGGSS